MSNTLKNVAQNIKKTFRTLNKKVDDNLFNLA